MMRWDSKPYAYVKDILYVYHFNTYQVILLSTSQTTSETKYEAHMDSNNIFDVWLRWVKPQLMNEYTAENKSLYSAARL